MNSSSDLQQSFASLQTTLNRRDLLANAARPLGAAALASLMGSAAAAPSAVTTAAANGGLPDLPHFAPEGKTSHLPVYVWWALAY